MKRTNFPTTLHEEMASLVADLINKDVPIENKILKATIFCQKCSDIYVAFKEEKEAKKPTKPGQDIMIPLVNSFLTLCNESDLKLFEEELDKILKNYRDAKLSDAEKAVGVYAVMTLHSAVTTFRKNPLLDSEISEQKRSLIKKEIENDLKWLLPIHDVLRKEQEAKAQQELNLELNRRADNYKDHMIDEMRKILLEEKISIPANEVITQIEKAIKEKDARNIIYCLWRQNKSFKLAVKKFLAIQNIQKTLNSPNPMLKPFREKWFVQKLLANPVLKEDRCPWYMSWARSIVHLYSGGYYANTTGVKLVKSSAALVLRAKSEALARNRAARKNKAVLKKNIQFDKKA